MMIYRVWQDDGFQFANPEIGLEGINALRLDGTPRGANWEPVLVRLVREDQGKKLLPSDISSLGVFPLVLRPKAVEAMRDIWEANGEILPLEEVSGEELYALNAQTIDALDEGHSDLIRFPSSGRIMDIRKPVFFADKIAGADVFKLPNNTAIHYVSQHFVDTYHQHDLRGLVFRKVWEAQDQRANTKALKARTLYLGPVEIRNLGAGEEVLLYPLASVRIAGGVATYLHTDQLGSIRVITDASGDAATLRTYKPFGETSYETTANPSEDHAFIGERRDQDAGLIYLNARYYDPALGLFTQPDWLEVTEPGVGTNRYAYSLNDPVNLSDPGGNVPLVPLAVAVFGALFGSAGPANAPDADGGVVHQSYGHTALNMVLGASGGALTGARAAAACMGGASCRAAATAYGLAETTADMAGCAGGDAGACAALAVPGVMAGGNGGVIEGLSAAPSGRRGAPLENPVYQSVRNKPGLIEGRAYSGHALDQMQNRGIPPRAVEDALVPENLIGAGNRPGTSIYYDAENGIRVVINDNGGVVTVILAGRN